MPEIRGAAPATEARSTVRYHNHLVYIYWNKATDPDQYYLYCHDGDELDNLQESLSSLQREMYNHAADSPYHLYQLTDDWSHDTAWRHMRT
eukprot:12082411-Heterocapsa_arctica.AAC.1